jgi:CHAT domain-containing protein
MSLSLSIPLIDNVLGGSVIYEEYKGNFAQARRIAEAALIDARGQKNRKALADALLARGVVHLLQGEPPLALKCFQELEQAVPSDFDRRLRALNYANLATYWQYNLFPDGGGAGGTELSALWNGVEYAKSEAPRREAVFRETTETLARFESWVIRDLLSNLLPSRSFVRSSLYSAPGAMTGTLLETALQGPAIFRQTAETYDADSSLLAFADLASADLCKRAGNTKSGSEFLNRALGVYQQSGDASGMAACRMMHGDWLAAPFSTPLVWNLAIQEGNSSGSDLSWTLEAAEFDFQSSDSDKAAADYEEAEKLFRSVQAPRGLAHIYLRRGYLAMLREDYPAAIDHAARAQHDFDACGDLLGYWLAQTHRILSRICAGQYPEEAQVAEAIGSWGAGNGSFSYALGLGLLLGRVGRHWLIRKGGHERALACYRLAELLFRELGATTNQAKSLVDQGMICRALGERDAALTLYEKALDKYREDEAARPSLAQTLRPQNIMLANDVYLLYLDKMDANGMERSAERLKSFEAKQSGGSIGQDLITQLLSGGVKDLLSSPESGSGLGLAETFALGNLIRTTVEQASVLVPLYRGRKARENGNKTEADRLFAEALSAAHATGEAQRDFLESQVFAHQKDYPRAAAAFRRYLARGGANAGFTGKLATLMQTLGGEQGQREALRQRERSLEQAFAFMVRVKAFAEAKSYLDELTKLAGRNWWDRDTQPWLNLSDCGEMHEGLKDLEKALDCYQRAISTLESRRSQLSRDELKTALAAGSGPQYLHFQAARAAAAAAQKSSDPLKANSFMALAFSFIEQGKARALLDLMAGSVAIAGSAKAEGEALTSWRECNSRLALWQGLLAQERSKREADPGRITELEKQIDVERAELGRVEAELARSNPNFYRNLTVPAEIMGAEEVCARLPKETALIQHAFLGEDLLVWGLTSKGIVKLHRAAVDAKALGREMRGFHAACMERKESEDSGLRLARMLLSPMDDVIQAHPRLLIVPYGPAHALPFHALPWKGKPLGADRVISYLPSASMLQFASEQEAGKHRDRILAIGNPTAMAYRHPLKSEMVPARALPAAGTEAAYIASLFPEGKALIADKATEEAVRPLIGRYPLLHFATHGVLSEDVPLLSAILLANGEALNVYELMGLQLNADLVVLSACETALGEVTGGDDVIGLTRGLLASGARAAVVSLWPVNDLSTSLLMGEFYRQLRDGKQPADCLHKAQNYLRTLKIQQIEEETAKLRVGGFDRSLRPSEAKPEPKDYSHPHYWAPFILVG